MRRIQSGVEEVADRSEERRIAVRQALESSSQGLLLASEAAREEREEVAAGQQTAGGVLHRLEGEAEKGDAAHPEHGAIARLDDAGSQVAAQAPRRDDDQDRLAPGSVFGRELALQVGENLALRRERPWNQPELARLSGARLSGDRGFLRVGGGHRPSMRARRPGAVNRGILRCRITSGRAAERCVWRNR